MRYQNWDALVFPENSRIPLQEFKTTCFVVHDHEYLQVHNTIFLTPTVTTFVPGLPAGNKFFASIHSWETPEPSRYALGLNKCRELIQFEARVFIDGRLAGVTIFGPKIDWPAVINLSIDMDKNGQMQSLKFPEFPKEVLNQNYWNADDNLGRIKIVIAEGVQHESPSMPFERIKNIVTFSFQHAPLELLEASQIAWPNPTMWRQVALPAQFLPQPVSPHQFVTGGNFGDEAHGHSPRRRDSSLRPSLPPPAAFGLMGPPTLFARPAAAYDRDPFIDPGQNPWMGRRPSSTDASMPDYSSGSLSHASYSRRATDPMLVDQPQRRYDMQSEGAFDSVCESLLPPAPVNTPQNATMDPSDMKFDAGQVSRQKSNSSSRFEKVILSSEARSGSAPRRVKSRKENHSEDSSIPANDVTPCHEGARKVAQGFVASGAKRQRVVTPVCPKTTIEDEESLSSPIARKVSQAQDMSHAKYRVLSNVDENIL